MRANRLISEESSRNLRYEVRAHCEANDEGFIGDDEL